MVASKKNETDREHRRTERLETELGELNVTLTSSKEKTILEQVEANERVKERIAAIEQQFKEQKRILEKLGQQEDLFNEDLGYLRKAFQEETS